MMEICKSIPNFSSYEVSNTGQVKRIVTKKQFKAWLEEGNEPLPAGEVVA